MRRKIFCHFLWTWCCNFSLTEKMCKYSFPWQLVHLIKKKKSEVTIFTLCTFKNFPFTLGESRPFLFPPPPPPVHYWLAFHLHNIAFKPHLRHLNGSESSLLWVVLFKEKKKKTSDAAFCHGLGGGMRNIPINQYGGKKKKKENKPLSQVHSTSPLIKSTPTSL